MDPAVGVSALYTSFILVNLSSNVEKEQYKCLIVISLGFCTWKRYEQGQKLSLHVEISL